MLVKGMQPWAIVRGTSIAESSAMADRFTHALEDRDDMEICPRCHRKRVVHLRSMARHSTLEWFKCDGCEHLFTREPVGREAVVPGVAEPKSAAP